MSRLYLSTVIGTGQQRVDPYRAKVFDYPALSKQVIELPSLPNGAPVKAWTLSVIDATDYTAQDADTDLASLGEMAALDTTISAGLITRINTTLTKFGTVTRATAGDTFRTLANRLLLELGSSVRL